MGPARHRSKAREVIGVVSRYFGNASATAAAALLKILTKPGEKTPANGVVVDGESSVSVVTHALRLRKVTL